MRHFKKLNGWTLLELLIVLVCVIALAAILLYSFITPTNRQASIRNVTAHISELVDAAHLWQHDHKNYTNISIDELKRKSLISDKWDSDSMANRYDIFPITDESYYQCQRSNSCFGIRVSYITHGCQYVTHLHQSGSVSSIPTFEQCYNQPNKQKDSVFTVIYD